MNSLKKTTSLLENFSNQEKIDFLELATCTHSLITNEIYDPVIIVSLQTIIENISNIEKNKLIEIERLFNDAFNIEKYLNSINFEEGKQYTITNSYYNESCSGVGDFLRGSCFLSRLFAIKKNIKVQIDFSHHLLGRYIKSNAELYQKEIFDTEQNNKDFCKPHSYFSNMIINLRIAIKKLKEKQSINVFSNFSDYVYLEDKKRFYYHISDSESKLMKNNIIFVDEVKDFAQKLNIKDFEIFHFRLGDREMLEKENLDENNINTKTYKLDYKKYAQLIVEAQKLSNNDIVVLSDSNKFKKFLQNKICNKNIHCIHFNSDHCSYNPGFVTNLTIDHNKKSSNMFYVALDMYLCTLAQKINSYSVYPWGSGFVFWIAKIFNIPIATYIIEDN